MIGASFSAPFHGGHHRPFCGLEIDAVMGAVGGDRELVALARASSSLTSRARSLARAA